MPGIFLCQNASTKNHKYESILVNIRNDYIKCVFYNFIIKIQIKKRKEKSIKLLKCKGGF